MKSPFNLEVGKHATPTFLGSDQNQQPYTNFTVQRPPTISDPTVLSYDPIQGWVTALPSGVGKSTTVTWVGIDNNDATKTASKVDTINVVAATLFLAALDTDYTIS